jgi:hypothetical protein
MAIINHQPRNRSTNPKTYYLFATSSGEFLMALSASIDE